MNHYPPKTKLPLQNASQRAKQPQAWIESATPPHTALFWLARYWPAVGGIELHTRALASELAQQRKVSVICHCRKDARSLEVCAAASAGGEWQDGPIRISRPAAEGWLGFCLRTLARHYPRHRFIRPLYAALLRKALQSTVVPLASAHDLIHCVYNGLTPVAELAAATARACDLPFVFTPSTCTTGQGSAAWSSRRFRRLYRQADAVVALTAFERAWLRELGVPDDKLHVCGIGALVDLSADGETLRRELNIGDAPLLLFLGRVTREKGVADLLAALPRIWQRCPDTRILIVGPASAEMADRLHAQTDHRLIVLPAADLALKSAALAACDLLCLPSHAESFGGVILEAWSFERPVIVNALPVMRTLICDGVDGLLCDTGNPEVLAQTVCDLLADQDLRQRLGQAGHQRLSSSFHWPALARQMARIHAAAMDHHARSRRRHIGQTSPP